MLVTWVLLDNAPLGVEEGTLLGYGSLGDPV